MCHLRVAIPVAFALTLLTSQAQRIHADQAADARPGEVAFAAVIESGSVAFSGLIVHRPAVERRTVWVTPLRASPRQQLPWTSGPLLWRAGWAATRPPQPAHRAITPPNTPTWPRLLPPAGGTKSRGEVIPTPPR